MSLATVEAARSAIADALNHAATELEATRKRIVALADERRRVSSAFDDFATIEAKIDRAIEAAQTVEIFSRHTFRTVEPSVGSLDGYLGKALAVHPFVLFAKMAPAALKEMALAEIDRDGGLSPAVRAAELDRLDAAIFREEIAEELSIRSMEDATRTLVHRRKDGDPALWLAPMAELLAAEKSLAEVD